MTEVDTNGPLAPGGSQPVIQGEVDTNGPLPGSAQPVVVQEVSTPAGTVQQPVVAEYTPDGRVDTTHATPLNPGAATTTSLATPHVSNADLDAQYAPQPDGQDRQG